MNAVERLSSYISRGVYTVSGPFHPFGGAVDIIVVEQPDGSFKSSPWYVKFGKFQGVLKTREKVVSVSVNGTEAGFHMYLDHKGEAYFLREVDGNECGSVFSPPSSGDETVEWAQKERSMNSQGIDFDGNQLNSVTQIDASNGKIVSRTNSRRSRIFGLVFGRKSMKEDGRCKKGEIDMQRINSLERAEIAADLLEVRWSTNLPTSGRTADTASPLTAPEVPTEETSKDVQVSDKQEPSRPSMHDSMNCSATDVDVENSCLQTHEQILQTIRDVENVHLDEPTVVPLQGPSFAESEADPVGYSSDFKKSNTNEESDRDDGHLTKNVSKENCERGVSTNMYSDTSISLRSGTNASGEGGLEILSFSDGGGEEVEVYTKVLYNTNEFISVMNSKLEPDVHMGKESLDKFDDSIQLSRGENSSESRNAENEGKMAPEKPIEKSSVFQSSSIDGEPLISETFSSLDIELLGLDSIESEEVEIIHQEAVVEKFNPEKTLKMKMSEISENQSRVTDTSSSLLGSTNGAGEERTPSAPDSCIGSVAVYQIPGSFKEGESNAASCSSHISKSMNQAQESENLGDTGDTHALHLSSVVYVNAKEDNSESLPEEVINSGMPPPNSLDEDQLLFRESDDFVVDCIRHEESTFADASKTDNQETQSTEEDHESNGVHHVSPLPSNQSLESQSFPIVGSYSPDLTQDLLPNAFEDWLEESQARSSPISIPKRHRFEGEAGHLVGSLPNMRDHIQDLEKSNVCKPLSRSLDLRTESSNWGTLREDLSSSLKLKLDTESNTVQDHPMAAAADALVNTQKMGEDEQMSSNPAVEISLCRHLLFDGMGLDAASRAFDGEKMDFKKFSDLGPLVVKNDKLVVRIGGRYFPWDVAAPIILGMVSFGLEPIFEPEGMIAVDQAERTLEGELSRAAIPSGGSWRLWPFHFRRSETERSVHPAPEGTKGKGAEVDNNASESAREVTGDNKMNKPKTPKKKAMQSRVPTSEQLASLDLKEGQNLITFTFSTAMLGRQQVDARIYLWKWNTRIVISDVDGTITKSDVLGQFMPLVGRDWSQSGVAHLFSSIKENGYQFLFLSARAISQAYLTRQFLFNLKQDGKALPDGPVLISPDGLFPSLYREVIRRAPHEFKIACLQVIRALFPPDCNPFYAGFGNRDTDEVSYLKVGIPKGKIFIINPKGEVAVNRRVDTKSYTSLHSLVHGMFPATSSAEQEEYNSWNFWKMPLPEINI